MRILSEWGLAGARTLIDEVGALVIVDVLSFSTCVDVATSRGAIVYPSACKSEAAAQAEAESFGAELASRRGDGGSVYSLSPKSLSAIPDKTKLLLPSPNGSAISAECGSVPVLAGCFRNARAVARQAEKLANGQPVGVVPAGEQWPDGSLRPAVEDLLGAGAVLHEFDVACSPEAEVARDAYRHALPRLRGLVHTSVSGRELISKGFAEDVEIALQLNVSNTAPLLLDGAFRAT